MESFGSRLRDLRERAGLTQEELAERAGLTPYAVSALERGRRNRPYPHTVRCLVDALGASDEDSAALVSAVPRRTRPGPAAPADSALDGPPAPAPAAAPALLGRDEEAAAVVDLLLHRGARLVTLTGTGGVGKTRLATALAARVAHAFPDGTPVVHLAPVGDARDVLPAVARAVGAPAGDVAELPRLLAEHLRGQRALLVLDNLEHVLDAAPAVADLVASCPELVVLATSRAPLRVRSEVEHPLQPLAVPAEDADAAAVAASAAVLVFLERARAVSPSFALTDANSAAVGAVCRRLAGIPLALELAAARVRFLDPQALLARLDDAMAGAGGRDLPARQRTMRATFDWSYDLLAPDEQQLLRLLAVFAGGCSLEAVEAVHALTGAGDDVLPLLEVLVEHSLVVVGSDDEGQPRYALLEPVAQYARSRTPEPELAAARTAHAAAYLDLAERASPEYLAAEQVVWLDRTDREHANLLAAMSWALESGDGETAGRMAWALWLYWWMRGRPEQGRRLTAQALQHELPPQVRNRATLTLACMSFATGDLASAGEHWRDAEVQAAAGDDVLLRGQSAAGVGLVELATGELAAAEACFTRALPALTGQGLYGEWLVSLTHVWLGTVQMLRGDLGSAVEQAALGLALARDRGDRLTAYVALFNLAQASIAAGDAAAAHPRLEEGIRLTQETGDTANLAYFLDMLAVVDASTGDAGRVGVLVGAAESLREAVGGQVYGYYQPDVELLRQAVAAGRAQLGDDAYDDALDAGRSLSAEDAAAYALGETRLP